MLAWTGARSSLLPHPDAPNAPNASAARPSDALLADFAYTTTGPLASLAVSLAAPSSDALANWQPLSDVSSKASDQSQQQQDSYAVTLLSGASSGLTLGHIAAVLASLSACSLTPVSIRVLSDRASSPVTALDIIASSSSPSSLAAIRAALYETSTRLGIDAAVQHNNVARRHKRLVIFDMDSTLIQQEVIDEIARHAGVVGQVSAITEAAMRGEIDFTESLKRRVALLKGTPASILDTVRGLITFSPGVPDLCRALKMLGFRLAVISGGFIPLARYVKATLSLDYAFANELKVSEDGLVLVGETVGPVVDGVRKAELLTVIAQTESVPREQVIAVGDGANDLLMMGAAGLGVAYRAKPKVQQQAAVRINGHSLLNLLHILGYDWQEIQDLLAMSRA
ncbi:HAD-like domain-containing protein [Entophlyctis helioformis]|nr:HAD-like domain-containing protein [Entophlyctis helioformis]